MQVHIEHDVIRNAYKVWIWRPLHTGGYEHLIGWDDDNAPLLMIVDQGQEPPGPTMILPEPVLKALVAAGAEKLPPADATVDAMKDARATRDRLLALVEHTIAGASPQTEAKP